jgi:tRNA 2-thiocytidine biosynthesis protein TtcA
MSKLHHHLRKRFEQTILKYGMLAEGDRVLVGVSGGADSLTLLKLLTGQLIFIPKPSNIIAVYVDMGFDDEGQNQGELLKCYFKSQGYQYRIEKTNIGPLAHSEFNRKASPCFLCSRLRRRKLFELARDFRCTKLALAHNKDDVIETFLLNVFFAREISTMIPNQPFFKGEFNLIRPLAYIEESLLKRFAKEADLPVMINPCPTAQNSKRKYIKDLLNKLDGENRGLKENVFKALKNVKPDYLLKK